MAKDQFVKLFVSGIKEILENLRNSKNSNGLNAIAEKTAGGMYDILIEDAKKEIQSSGSSQEISINQNQSSDKTRTNASTSGNEKERNNVTGGIGNDKIRG